MQVDEMNDQEKSALLAKAMGWETRPYADGTDWFRPTKEHEYIYDLYATNRRTKDPLHMALAWRVHIWALDVSDDYSIQWYLDGDLRIWEYPDAQRRWLDEILSMLIEAGLVEANHAQAR